ncbi:thioredoxin family protein [Nafulsella turpanensis]|uniref:thioredoxin family protein n=1 Tax=Nafulsella turpanensis TaxID=1265690 RepID=UPI00037CD0E5|nr:thioredoxin family protein [Nafulsella turpanensis]
MNNPVLNTEILQKGISFQEYIQLTEQLLAENKTTGTDHSEFMVEYTRLNMQRMRRLIKTTLLINELREVLDTLDKKMVWVVLTEAWCGDAAQIVPVIAEAAKYAGEKIELQLLLRDEHPEVMDQYLTNGGRSIPKLIALEAGSLQELGSWGPRPVAAQQMVMEAKAANLSKEDFIQRVHKWYADNKTLDTQKELLEKIREWSRG